LADLRLTRNGAPVSLAGATLTEEIPTTFLAGRTALIPQTWTLGNLGPATSAGGAYVLTLVAAGSGVRDEVGNPLAADAAVTWTVDTTPPTAAFAPLDADPRSTPVGPLALTFTEAVVGFGAADLRLTRDGAAVPLPNVGVTTQDGTHW